MRIIEIHQASRPRPTVRLVLAAAALLTSAVLLLVGAPGASAAGSCTLYASNDGSGSAPGTQAAPLLTAQQMVDRMSPGDVGCLIPSGSFTRDAEVRIDTPDVTITTAPGSGSQAFIKTRFYVTKNADDTTIENLAMNTHSARNHALTINGDRVTLRDNDITSNNTDICIIVGNSDPQWGRAHDTLITGNKIHNCGEFPSTNLEHGIYVSAADRTKIVDNWIYDNADRGIQLYSDADDSIIRRNVIDGNGEGVIFGGEQTTSDGNLVANNVITNSKLRDNIESYWGEGGVGTGNVARDNCVSGGAYDDGDGGILQGTLAKLGFRSIDNLVADPLYVDRGAKDFTLRDGSPCAELLAGGSAPQQAGSGRPERIKLKTNRRAVRSGSRLQVGGKAPGARRVKIVRKTASGWKRISAARVRSASRFRTKVRAAGRRSLKIKAKARGLRPSRAIRVRLR